jgi:hypothetical protein
MIGLLAAAMPTLPVPSDYRANHTAAVLFTIWAGGFALLALPYCIHRLRKYQDVVPLFAWLGGFILSLGEPMLDYLGHLWWPTNLPGPAFKGYGLNVPLLIPPCYAFFVSMTGYFAYRQFQRGLTVKGVFYVWLAILSTDFALEFPGVLTDVYKYYGKQPFYIGNFPLHWAWLNGTGFLVVGFLLWALVPRLQGAQTALILLVPLFAFLGSYGMTAMPAFASLNWHMSPVVQHIVDLSSLGLSLIVVRAIAEVVHTRETVVTLQGAGNGRRVAAALREPAMH